METEFLKYFAEESCKSCYSAKKADKCKEFDECSSAVYEYYSAGYNRGRELLMEDFKKGKLITEKPIDKVTVQNLDAALHVCGVELNNKLIDLIIDLVEVLEVKGCKATIDDIIDLRSNRR